MGGKYVDVSTRDLKTDHNRLTLDLTKEQLQQAQNYCLENSNTGAGSSTSPVHGDTSVAAGKLPKFSPTRRPTPPA